MKKDDKSRRPAASGSPDVKNASNTGRGTAARKPSGQKRTAGSGAPGRAQPSRGAQAPGRQTAYRDTAAAGKKVPKKKKRRRISRFHMAVAVVVALLLVAGAVTAFLLLAPRTPVPGAEDGRKTAVFGVSNITVEGDTRYSSEDIIEKSGVFIGQSVFSVNKKKAAEEKAAVLAEEKAAPVAADAAPEQAPAPTPTPEKAETPAKKPSARGKAASAGKKAPAEKKAPSPGRKKASAKKAAAPAEEKPAAAEKPAPVEEKPAPVEEVSAPVNEIANLPRRSIAFIGSECHPFVKTGGLGDVMYALPRELARLNCDVRVILPRYACIPQEYQDKMIYRGEFYMDLGNTGRSYYVGIMEYIWDGVVYDFIDNQEFFTAGRPYTNLVDDIPKYCFFSKA